MPLHRSKRLRNLLQYCFYLAILLGYIATNFDIEQRRFTASRLVYAYHCTVTALTVLLTPLALYTTAVTPLPQHLDVDKYLVELSGTAVAYTRILVLLIAYTANWRKRAHFRYLVERFVAFDRRYFAEFSDRPPYSRLHRRYELWIVAKLLLTAYRTLSAIAFQIEWRHVTFRSDFAHALLHLCHLLYTAQAITMLNMEAFLFFYSVLGVCRNCHLLNERLEVINAHLREGPGGGSRKCPGGLAASINAIGEAHVQAQRLLECFVQTFEFQLIAIIFIMFVGNVGICFYAVVRLQDTNRSLDLAATSLIAGSILLYLIDLYALIYFCDLTEQYFHRTSVILRGFGEFAPLDRRLERSCDQLATILCCGKVKITLGKFFRWNKKFGLSMFHQILLTTIVLVQFDLKYNKSDN